MAKNKRGRVTTYASQSAVSLGVSEQRVGYKRGHNIPKKKAEFVDTSTGRRQKTVSTEHTRTIAFGKKTGKSKAHAHRYSVDKPAFESKRNRHRNQTTGEPWTRKSHTAHESHFTNYTVKKSHAGIAVGVGVVGVGAGAYGVHKYRQHRKQEGVAAHHNGVFHSTRKALK